MAGSSLYLSPGKVVVFEGLDKACKSTQLELLKVRIQHDDSVAFAHMPSGWGKFSRDLYEILERDKPSSDLGRQLTHLACHCENMAALVQTVESCALVLDRWWWSTVAYGWYGGDVEKAGISETVFRELIATIWKPIRASIVFLFLMPYEDDKNNVVGVAEGYRILAAQQPTTVITVPMMSSIATHEYIISELVRAGIAELR